MIIELSSRVTLAFLNRPQLRAQIDELLDVPADDGLVRVDFNLLVGVVRRGVVAFTDAVEEREVAAATRRWRT